MIRKLFPLLLALAVLLQGCGGLPGAGSSESEETRPHSAVLTPRPSLVEQIAGPQGPTYFKDVWRGDVDYSEMEYEHYEETWFWRYTEPFYRFAEEGGTAEEFSDADFELTDELYYVYTLMELMELRNSADPEDAEVEAEYLYAQDLYYKLSDEFNLALHALAVSPYVSLMEDVYSADLIEEYADYEGADEDEFSLYNQENELINEYYRLMAQEEIDTDAVGYVYLQLVELWNTEAELYGLDSYAEYAYYYDFARDYGPEDTRAVWDGVKESIVPLMQRYARSIWRGVERLESDDSFDCSLDAILDAMDGVLPQMSGELYTAFRYMQEHGLCDADLDPRKANTGYTMTLYYYNEPFIFNAPYGEFNDYMDMFHEFGHFTNAFYNRSDLLYGVSDFDLSELQSQGLEMLFTHYYDEIFGQYADAARSYALLRLIYSVVDGALYDEFQQRVFSEKDLTVERVNEIYAALYEEYGYVPYDGYETEWMFISHNFDMPFYYVSYCVSALGALELYQLAESDWDDALDKYLTICAMDTEEYYYSEAVEEVGLSDTFAPETYADIAAAMERSFR